MIWERERERARFRIITPHTGLRGNTASFCHQIFHFTQTQVMTEEKKRMYSRELASSGTVSTAVAWTHPKH